MPVSYTHLQRMEDFHPDEIIYVVDKRQELHFIQVFRCAKKANMVDENTKLTFVGFGTMNGKDGKPFKTREGGVMRLERLLSLIHILSGTWGSIQAGRLFCKNAGDVYKRQGLLF